MKDNEKTKEQLMRELKELRSRNAGLEKSDSERRQAEESIREAHRKLQATLGAVPDLMFEVDREGRIYDYHAPEHETLYVQPAVFLGKTIGEMLPEDAARVILQALAEADQKGWHRGATYSLDLPTGRRYYELSIAVKDEAEIAQRRFVILARDITKRKSAEEALKDSENRLMLALDATNDGLWDWDIRKGTAYLSPKYYEMTGYEPAEVIPDMTFFKRLLHPDDFPGVMKTMDDHLRGKKAQSFIDYRMITKDGTVKWIAGRGKVVERGSDGTPLRMAGTISDITDRKRAEEEIRKLNQELQRRAEELEIAYKDIESFSYVVSHDLKAPIRRMEGFSDVLSRDYADKIDDTGKDILKRIAANARTMGQLINDLLAFSRVSTREIQKSDINMEILTKKVFEELKPSAGEHTVQLTFENMPFAYGDLSMMRQVIMNLLSNALKFTRIRETAIIEIGGRSETTEDLFFVKDNGIGFDMQFSDKLFGLFQRIHISKQFEGTGIGLVSVKKIIEKHGGRVWAEGKVNDGATFYFTLPRKELCPM